MTDQREEWVKELVRLDIAKTKELIEEATVEEGVAIGVYYTDDVYHIDWVEGGRTTVERSKYLTR